MRDTYILARGFPYSNARLQNISQDWRVVCAELATNAGGLNENEAIVDRIFRVCRPQILRCRGNKRRLRILD